MKHFYIARRYFGARKGMTKTTTHFALSGIVLGVAALIVVMAVMAGFRNELMDRILGISGHVSIMSKSLTTENAEALALAISAEEGITYAEPYVQGQAMVMSKAGGASGVLVRGVDLNRALAENSTSLPFEKVTYGDPSLLTEPNTIMLGEALARKIGASIGSSITLISPAGKTTPFGFVPRMKKYRVVALFKIGMHMYDSAWGYMSIPSAQSFYKLDDRLTAMDVRMDNPNTVDAFKPKLANIFTLPNSYIQTWKDSNAQFFEALKVERIAMFIILTLIIVVAAFNIVTGQTMMVNDKRGDIAMLRTMGARKKDILNIFLINGLMVGVLGTVIGVTCGVLIVAYLKEIVMVLETLFHVSIFSGEAYFLDEIPTALNMMDVAMISLVSLLLSILAALYPALKAAKMNPVEILRG